MSSPSGAPAGWLDFRVLEGGERNSWKTVRVPPESARCAEEAVFYLCRHALNVTPLAAPLFGLRTGHQAVPMDGRRHWLSPDQELGGIDRELFPLELRVRFKAPMPSKLHDLDKLAFLYYYWQVGDGRGGGYTSYITSTPNWWTYWPCFFYSGPP